MRQNPTQSQRVTILRSNTGKSATGESWWLTAPQNRFTKQAEAILHRVDDSTVYAQRPETEGFRD